MPLLRTTSLEDGMILSKDALDGAGRVVLRAGTAVDRAARNKLLVCGIQKVAVRGDTGVRQPNGKPSDVVVDPDALPKKSETALVQESLLKIAHMFNDHRDDRVMRELCRLAIKCAQERLISG